MVRARVEILLPRPGVLERHELIEIGPAVDHGLLIHRDALAALGLDGGDLVLDRRGSLLDHGGRNGRYLRRRLDAGLRLFGRFDSSSFSLDSLFSLFSLFSFFEPVRAVGAILRVVRLIRRKATDNSYVVLVVIPGQLHVFSSLFSLGRLCGSLHLCYVLLVRTSFSTRQGLFCSFRVRLVFVFLVFVFLVFAIAFASIYWHASHSGSSMAHIWGPAFATAEPPASTAFNAPVVSSVDFSVAVAPSDRR